MEPPILGIVRVELERSPDRLAHRGYVACLVRGNRQDEQVLGARLIGDRAPRQRLGLPHIATAEQQQLHSAA